MKIAVLVRHGESISNTKGIISSDIEGYPLTKKGHSQAEFAAKQLSLLKINRIRSSPVQRARETAETIGAERGIRVETDERLRESYLGKFNNTEIGAFPAVGRSRAGLGVETWEEHQERMLRAIESVSGIEVLVSHALPIRSAVSKYMDLGEVESYGVEIRNCSISMIDVERGKLLSLGSLYVTPKNLEYISDLIDKK
ncbi:MAG: histidine phosphatase family protein [Thermoplasmatales archaeon]|nr:histidine phosphatase family protein [Thermoplasmatales archaeon]MCW6170041.1 histidine phosphatase family protein [Thermoplasmatales archaeon]